MRRVYKNLCPATVSSSIMATNMWENSSKNVESDKNNILYETLLVFLYSETVLTFWISLVLTCTSLPTLHFRGVNSMPSATRWDRSAVSATFNKTETPWFLPTGDGSRYRCRKHKQTAEIFHKCRRNVAHLSQNTEFQCRYSLAS